MNPLDANIAAALACEAREQPGRAAMLRGNTDGRFDRVNFGELEHRVSACAAGLVHIGVTPGMRTILMIPPSADFFAITFALMRIGAVPVLIDPGMGKRHMVHCLAGVQAEAFIGIPLAHALRKLFPASFRTVRILVTLGRRWCWGGHTLRNVEMSKRRNVEILVGRVRQSKKTEIPPAAILFTTGSTGPPKGVVYRHETFHAQVTSLRDHFGLTPGQVDLATFPLFALFDAALGVTAVIPNMDPTRPGFVDPYVIIDAIESTGCTNLFASPALLDRVGKFGVEHGVKLITLRRVITAGAPVRPDILERFTALLPDDAEIITGYGATEALPVAAMTHREILSETQMLTARGAGVCVGRAVGDVEIRIIRISDEPLAEWSDDLLMAPSPIKREDRGVGATADALLAPPLTRHIGEIVVRDPIVTHEYFNNPTATALAKIRDGDSLWHRMGDVGYLDALGRLWMCGRKSHRVETEHGMLFTECVEAIFNQHAAVHRTALIGLGERPRQTPVLCVELRERAGRHVQRAIADELRDIALCHDMTREIETYLFHPRFPVDIRHNAKIFREKLRHWAMRRLTVV